MIAEPLVVYPTFDLRRGQWFTDCGCEAPSLRELARILPPGTTIVGYYPEGFSVPASMRASPVLRCLLPMRAASAQNRARQIAALRAQQMRKTPVEIPQPVAAHLGRAASVNYHGRIPLGELLDLRARGMTLVAIARRLGCTKSLVDSLLKRAREAGDPRASLRMGGRIHSNKTGRPIQALVLQPTSGNGFRVKHIIRTRWTDAQKQEARRLLDSGMSASQVGAQLGFTRNAVLGMVWRMRVRATLHACAVPHA